ncbi:MAG: hypothetical protein RSA92_04145, partial [Bacteroidaceae bacterium]
MKKNIIIYSLFLTLPLLTSCKDEITGDFGNFGVKPQMSIESLCEYDSLGNEKIKEYKLKIAEEKDTFWLRSYIVNDTLSRDSIKDDNGVLIKVEYKTKKREVFYNDMSKKARFVCFDTVRLAYSDKGTEVKILIRSNAKWKASKVEKTDPEDPQDDWLFETNMFGNGDSYLIDNALAGLCEEEYIWTSRTQQVYL